MRILVLNWRDIMHPLAGGAEQSLHKHASYWKEKGAEVAWLSSGFENGKKSETIDGIKIFRHGSHYSVHLFAFFYIYIRSFFIFDIVIDSFHFVPFFSPLYIRKKKIVALINEPAKKLWFRNISFPLSLIGYLSERAFFLPYKQVPFITSARSIARELEEFGISEQDIHIIPHGINIPQEQRKNLNKQKNALIFLAQISEDKGIKDALQALVLLSKHMPDIHLNIVGKEKNASYLLEIKKLIKKLGIESHVTFWGYVSDERKYNLLQQSMILIHPSAKEGWGLNVIEANVVGTPAVGYNVSGLRDSIQNKETGLLTGKNTPDDLARKIEMLLLNKTLYEKLVNNCLKWAKKFSWEVSTKQSWELINKVHERN